MNRASDEYVVVEKYNEKYLEDSMKYPPYDYYVGNNVIIPENSEFIYYHNTRLICGTGWSVSSPSLPIDFETHPLLQFSSVDEFSSFLKNYTPTPRLILFVSDSDTIRNKNYFDLSDTVSKFEGTYVIASRKVTPDEFEAIANSRWLEIDMEDTCNIDEL